MSELQNVIAAANEVFMGYFNSNEITKMSELYTEDCKLMPTGAPTVEGRKGCASVFQSVYDAGNVKVKLVIQEVGMIHSDCVAYERSKYYFYNAKGEETDNGKYIVIWKKLNGTWYLYTDMFNTNKS